MSEKYDILKTLEQVIKSRKSDAPENSYVAKLFSKGRKKIAQKVGEEAIELCIAAAHNDKAEAVSESADLLFHMMVLWADMELTADDIYDELRRREGVSGIDEKKSRGEFVDGL